LLEPFCGSAAVSIGARARRPGLPVTISDTNQSITNLWESIVRSPNALADGYETVWEAQFSGPETDPGTYFSMVRARYGWSYTRSVCGWWVVGGGGGEAPVAGGAGGLHLMSQKNGLTKQGIE